MIRILWGILLCCYVCCGHVYAQTGCYFTLKLTAQEAHNFSPVHPAVLYITELKKAVETNEDGTAVFDSLCAGQYTVHVHGAGYEDKIEKITLLGSMSVKLKVRFSEHSLQEVTVSDEHKQSLLQANSQLNSEAIQAQTGKTLADMLQSVNGVSVLGNGATIAKPVIHGMHSNRIVMLNNGIRQEDQQWGGEHAPNIDPFLANSMTVVKGAAGVRYGTDAIGGVVLVEPAPLRHEPGWSGEANLAAFSNNRMGAASIMLEHATAKVPGLAFRLQGTFKKGGNYRIPGYWAANTGVQEANYSATIAYRKLHWGGDVFYSHFNTVLGIYRGSHTGNQADLEHAIESDVPLIPASFTYDIARPKQEVTHDLVKAKLYAENRQGMWNLTYGLQRNLRREFDIVRVENGKAQLNLTLTTHTLNLNLDHKAIGKIKGQIGLDGLMQDNRFEDGDRLFIPTYQAYSAAGYLIERYRKGDWMVEGGLRYDIKQYRMVNFEGSNQQKVIYNLSYNNLSGTLGVRQKLTQDWQWSATVAQAWRAPQANELFSAGLHHGAARIEIGNKALKPEQSYSLNLGTEYSKNKLRAEVSLYSQLINDYIYLEPGEDLLTIRGYFKTFNFKQTNAGLNGTDIDINYEWNDKLKSTGKASLLRAWNRTAKDWLILMPSDRYTLNTRYTRSFNDHWQDCYAEIEGKYVTQQTRIPSNFDSIDHPRPPAAYFLLGASVGAQTFIRKQPIHFSIAATNLLNIKYRDYLDAFRYFIDQPGTNIALRVRVPFEFPVKG